MSIGFFCKYVCSMVALTYSCSRMRRPKKNRISLPMVERLLLWVFHSVLWSSSLLSLDYDTGKGREVLLHWPRGMAHGGLALKGPQGQQMRATVMRPVWRFSNHCSVVNSTSSPPGSLTACPAAVPAENPAATLSASSVRHSHWFFSCSFLRYGLPYMECCSVPNFSGRMMTSEALFWLLFFM
jgi:hypothetical protein